MGKFTCTFFLFYWYLILNIIMCELTNWRNLSSRSRPKCFIQPVFFYGLYHILNFECSFCNFELSHFFSKLKNRRSGNSRQNSPIKWWSNKFVLTIFIFPEHENIHCANFSNIIVKKPQNLITPMLFNTFSARFNSWSIIST